MPGETTQLQLPYPLPDDPIADGATQIKALAETIDTKLHPLKIVMQKTEIPVGKTSGNDLIFETVDVKEPFTKILGAYCTECFMSMTSIGQVARYYLITDVDVSPDSTKLTVRGRKMGSNLSKERIHILIWGY
ncbi:hypothetical protein [Mobiluncus curtisii]|uniref:Uncharacterized protein n=1 Tax=Mobiluncus curtisii TaxID=2051 RepID=A0A7Y0YCC9_9ACTO|nr:hypothetical protein [Mobiluncus curtisii]NMW87474.1 hypothetical protein [Mobiluncus curtisii]